MSFERQDGAIQMSDLALRVNDLGKLYQLGKSRHTGSLRETLASTFAAPRRQQTQPKEIHSRWPESDRLPSQFNSNSFWALRNISFEINKGEIVGIIGPNGSGKSTLLKIFAEITEPTEGEVYIDGRLTALIELGAGFHPELTGRENIYLNGAILGLSKQLIDRDFDEILDFAELRDFVDTPLKHYSSGMTVRLGFSLAVHADPDILLVDEVLAVGDASFRRRCFSKIDEFIRAKKTIVIVTHNLAEAQRVAQRLILIDKGQVVADGKPDHVIEKYAALLPTFIPSDTQSENAISHHTAAHLPITITGVQVVDGDGKQKHTFRTHSAMQLRISYLANAGMTKPVFRAQIYRSDGVFCHGMNTERQGLKLANLDGAGVITLSYPDLGLVAGDYSIHVSAFLDSADELPVHQRFNPPNIHVESGPADGAGIFAMPTHWSVQSHTPGPLSEPASAGGADIVSVQSVELMKMAGKPRECAAWSPADVVCIIGMHRSGTSMVARLLSLCGLYLGSDDRLLGPNDGNPEGHFEHTGFLQIDEELLRHFGGAWESPPRLPTDWHNDPALNQITAAARALIDSFSSRLPWGWKEPRTTVLLEFWKSLVPNLRFVICVRNPLDVAKSLASRNGLAIRAGILLWYRYMRDALQGTAGYPVIFTFYDDYFVDAGAEIQRLARFCRLPEPDNAAHFREIVSGNLRHHAGADRELLDDDGIDTEIKMLYLMLRSLSRRDLRAADGDIWIQESVTAFVSLGDELRRHGRVGQLESPLTATRLEMNEMEFRLQWAQQKIAQVEQQFDQLQQRTDRLQLFADTVRQTPVYRLYSSLIKPFRHK